MTRSAVLFLILLRLAVGWHFFYEGMLKYRSTRMGPTVTSRPFTSGGYFREAPGPLGDAWRQTMGDADQDALAHLVVKPVDDKDDPTADNARLRMPPALKKEWEEYVSRFEQHYGLTAEQSAIATAKLHQAETQMVDFLTYTPPAKVEDQVKDTKYPTYTTEVTRPLPPSGDFKRRLSMTERIAEYRAKLEQMGEAKQKMWLMWKDVEGPKLRSEKMETASLRAGLLKDVEEKTQELHKQLDGVLTKEQKAETEMKAPPADFVLGWIDKSTMWGLMAIGACLMMGLFTRTSAWLGALFLLMTYLAVPPWPWLPSPPASEGNYLFVNKNVIELLALCVLATTFTGRWCGVDGILHRMRCWMTGKQPQL